MKKIFVLSLLLCFCWPKGHAQAVEEDQLGAWYMYFYNKRFKNSNWGVQGDFQFRYWGVANDLEQVLLRSGITYTPKNSGVTFTQGYASITSGVPGESTETSHENRLYQEALFSQVLGTRFYLTHRMRSEQRFVEDQDFRTRYRYMLFVNVPLNQRSFQKGALYAALYNELFINGERNIGDQRSVEIFDRNRTYLGMGYFLSPTIRLQLGWMRQTTDLWSKDQLQLSVHHNF